MATTALAAPTPAKKLAKRSFRIPSVPRIGVARSPADEMARTYRKFGWQIILLDPPSPFESVVGGESTSSASVPAATSSATALASSTTASGNGSEFATSATVTTSSVAAPAATSTAAAYDGNENGEVDAAPESNESEYLSPVTVGGQSLNLDFDTGSADFWMFSSSMPLSQSQGHSTFNASKSSTWSVYKGASWEISYGDGSSASGTVGFDTVDIGGATVTSQAVELATGVSGSFTSDVNNDGLVGLGFSSINTIQPQQQKTFFENIMDDLEQPVFTADLEDNATGSYNFGTIDPSEYTGDIHFTAVDKSNGFWEFASDTYTVGGNKSQCQTCSPAIADTGTSLVLVDDDVAAAYYGQVSSAVYDSSQGGYTYNCTESLPTFGIAIGSDYTATLQGADITFAQIDSQTCFGGIQGNSGGGIQIMGDILLKQFFAVFDGGNETFGVAEKSSKV
ncbi:hypothetical protein LTR08_001872 [Meristemomyces frigidus]|nr:hypothetical protein LTR08_001872 [Meristemomyces frigidus]